MFVGHYGVALAAKRYAPELPLGHLFIATQLLDIAFATLLLAGVERVRLHPDVPGPSGVELTFVPFSHGLAGVLVLGTAAAVLVALPQLRVVRVESFVVAGVVASHYILDIVVHRGELPLITHRAEIGIGVPVAAAVAVESLLVLSGLWIYLRSTSPRSALGRVGVPIMAAILIACNAFVATMPPPGGTVGLALSNLAAYATLAGAAYWLEPHRVPRQLVRRSHPHVVTDVRVSR